MKGFEFLKTASTVAIEPTKSATARTSTAKARNPENADIRVYKDGSVYPSAALVAEFNLAYVGKDVEAKGNAFDVFASTKYPHTMHWPAEQKAMLIAAVDRKLPKTDLFSGSKYDEAGEPKADVLTQGSNTFGAQLLTELKDIYGIEPNEDGFVDLVIMRDVTFKNDNGLYYVPKEVSRGENKGKSETVTRENITVYPLVPVMPVTEDVPSDDSTELVEGDAVPQAATKASKVAAATEEVEA